MTPADKGFPITVEYFHELKDEDGKLIGTGNIIWAKRDRGDAYYRVSRFAMQQGFFPSNHPACPGGSGGSDSLAQCGVSDELNAFRARGYWASCFPEGDGITMHCLRGQTAHMVGADIQRSFGWNVEIRRT